MKIRSVGSEMFRADRRTDEQTNEYEEASSPFLKFCERAYKPVSVL